MTFEQFGESQTERVTVVGRLFLTDTANGSLKVAHEVRTSPSAQIAARNEARRGTRSRDGPAAFSSPGWPHAAPFWGPSSLLGYRPEELTTIHGTLNAQCPLPQSCRSATPRSGVLGYPSISWGGCQGVRPASSLTTRRMASLQSGSPKFRAIRDGPADLP